MSHSGGEEEMKSALNLHQLLVAALAEFLASREGLQLLGVAHENYAERPWEIEGYTPDIIAYDPSEELLALGEAKTCEEVGSRDAGEQLKVFASLAMESGKSEGKPVPVHVIVPESCRERLVEQLTELGIVYNVKVWSYG